MRMRGGDMARRGAGVVRTQTTDLLGLLPPTPGHLLRTPLFIDRWGGVKNTRALAPSPGSQIWCVHMWLGIRTFRSGPSGSRGQSSSRTVLAPAVTGVSARHMISFHLHGNNEVSGSTDKGTSLPR